jgi:hemerythrin
MFNWDSSYSVGIQEMDDQHRKLIEIINELGQTLDRGENRDAAVKVLNGLVAYTKEHFALEELYFRQFDYEKTDEHINEHVDLVAQVEKLIYQFETTGKFDIPNVIEFLKTWLLEHILGADQEYVRCFKDNGL